MFDLLITNGQLVDGNGTEPVTADIAVTNGRISAIRQTGESDLGPARNTLDATGCIVTPGFIDLHTHYDGQISWDEELKPSVNHGVTTAVMGNCGVGFAPCRASDRDRLIRLMEGVEDIPGTALHEGITWDWETFPQYLDAIDAMDRTIDVAAMIPHDPLRVYVMGDRAMHDEPANPDDIAAMKSIVHEAVQAGAVGVSTGRSDAHKTADGEWTPASEAALDELVGLGSALDGLGHGVLQAVSDFDQVRPEDNFDAEWEILRAYFRSADRPGSISLMQRDFAPDDWRKIMARSEEDDLGLLFQVAPRAIGAINGLQCSFHPLMAHPSYLAIRELSLAERVERMHDPAFRTQLLSETPIPLAGPGSLVPPMIDMMIGMFPQLAEKNYRLASGDSVDYEPKAEDSLAAHARRNGLSVWEQAYDWLIEDDGRALIYYPVYNYTDMNYDAVHEMLSHPQAIPGLSDGGAHVGTICDASFPTYLLTHWARDRGARDSADGIPLPRAVQMLTADAADYLGFTDRGRLEIGLKADLNVIDLTALKLGVPEMIQDLPAGGQRLLQPVSGYRATYVSGHRVIADDNVTTARPGRLVRSRPSAAIAAE